MKIPGETLICRIVDVFENGVGKIARPWIIKRESLATAEAAAEARRIDRLAEEKLKQELRDIRAGRKRFGEGLHLISASSDANASDERQIQKIGVEYLTALDQGGRLSPADLTAAERELNLLQIVALAVEEAWEHEDVSVGETPDSDWFAQWRNRAQDVSNEDMQRLWARVLKGECLSAGSFSIHTLDFLSRMSREDAELIAKLSPYVISGNAIYSKAQQAFSSSMLTLSDFIYLEDLGIVNGAAGTLSKVQKVNASDNGVPLVVIKNNKVALIFNVKSNISELRTPALTLSSIATQLLQLVEPSICYRYLEALTELHESNCDTIRIGDIIGEKVENIRLFRDFAVPTH
jgi:hypothetical protein